MRRGKKPFAEAFEEKLDREREGCLENEEGNLCFGRRDGYVGGNGGFCCCFWLECVHVRVLSLFF